MTELPKSGEIWTIAGSMVRVAHVIDDRVTCTQIVDAGQPCESWTYGVGEFMARFRRSTTAEAHSDPTPRARGQNTCRAALMTVIGLHRRENTLGPDMARAIVDATQALMDLDGLRASEAAALDVAKERDEARALADGLTRGQGDLRRKLAAMEAERDRLVEANAPTGPYPPYAGSGVLVVVRDGVVVERKRPAAAAENERAMRILGWRDEPPDEWAQATIDDVQVLERMLQRALDRKKRP